MDHQQEMQQRAQRNQRHAGLSGRVLVVFVMLERALAERLSPRLLAHVGFALQTIAGSGGERQNRSDDRDDANQRQHEAIAAGDVTRQRQDRVADDAAKSGRERPAIRDREQRSGRGRANDADEPKNRAQASALDAAMGQQAKTERRDRQQGGAGGDADRLHEEIRDDRAGQPEQIMHAGVGGLIEGGVARGPGEERQRQGGASGERRQSQKLGEASPREFAKRIVGGAEGLAARHGSC